MRKLPDGEAARRSAEQKRAWRAANPDYSAQWYAANKDRVVQKALERYRANPAATFARNAKYQAAHPDVCRERAAKWRKANRDKMRVYSANYRAAKLRAIPAWADMEQIKRFYAAAAEAGMHVDHIIPLRGRTVCGLHVENNLQMLTKSANSRKHNRLIEEA